MSRLPGRRPTLFPELSPGPVIIEGRTLWLVHWLPVVEGDRVYLRFEAVAGHRRQGIRASVERHHNLLRAGDETGNVLTLWADRGPRLREIEHPQVDEPRQLALTNCWDEDGRTAFMEGPAWLEVEPQPDGTVLLRASDGTSPVGRPTLVVRVSHERDGRLVRAT